MLFKNCYPRIDKSNRLPREGGTALGDGTSRVPMGTMLHGCPWLAAVQGLPPSLEIRWCGASRHPFHPFSVNVAGTGVTQNLRAEQVSSCRGSSLGWTAGPRSPHQALCGLKRLQLRLLSTHRAAGWGDPQPAGAWRMGRENCSGEDGRSPL